MILTVDGAEVFATTGGKSLTPELPLVVFLHGAGFDQAFDNLCQFLKLRADSVIE